MKIIEICNTCGEQHPLTFNELVGPGAAFSDWLVKHPGHDIEFRSPNRSPKPRSPWGMMSRHNRIIRNRHYLELAGQRRIRASGHHFLDYLHNADVKTAYGASVAPTLTLASLAASSTLLAGRESTAVDNGASNKYLEYLVAGHFKTAASNAQVGSINVAIVAAEDDSPTWQDVFDGTDSTETVSLQSVYDQVCKVLASITTTASNALTWPFGMTSVAGQYGGNIPDQFVFFVSHNAETSTNAWSATEGDHAVKMTPVYLTVIG